VRDAKAKHSIGKYVRWIMGLRWYAINLPKMGRDQRWVRPWDMATVIVPESVVSF